jgi:hypothetical protein
MTWMTEDTRLQIVMRFGGDEVEDMTPNRLRENLPVLPRVGDRVQSPDHGPLFLVERVTWDFTFGFEGGPPTVYVDCQLIEAL